MKPATILFTLFTLPSIIMRHDVSDQAYVDYGRRPEFQSFAYFSDGGGALVAPDWVLTARHVGEGLTLNDMVWIGVHYAVIDDISDQTYLPGYRAHLFIFLLAQKKRNWVGGSGLSLPRFRTRLIRGVRKKRAQRHFSSIHA